MSVKLNAKMTFQNRRVYEHYAAKMREEYDLDYESALPLRFEEFDINTCRQEIRPVDKGKERFGKRQLRVYRGL